MKGSSLSTFAKLSFAVTSPGVAATDDQINTFLGTLRRGVAPSIADMAAFKRVLFESQTLMMHSLKATAKGEETTPKENVCSGKGGPLGTSKADVSVALTFLAP